MSDHFTTSRSNGLNCCIAACLGGEGGELNFSGFFKLGKIYVQVHSRVYPFSTFATFPAKGIFLLSDMHAYILNGWSRKVSEARSTFFVLVSSANWRYILSRLTWLGMNSTPHTKNYESICRYSEVKPLKIRGICCQENSPRRFLLKRNFLTLLSKYIPGHIWCGYEDIYHKPVTKMK